MLFGVNIPENDKRSILALLAEYYHLMDCWLDDNFDGLKSVDNWEMFYIHLVQRIVKMMNDKANKAKSKFQINADDIVMPGVTELFKACRLLWQATSSLQNGIPDGQHRVTTMMELLEGWTIKLDPTKTPLKEFVPRSRSVETGQNTSNYPNNRDELNVVLETLRGKAITRVIMVKTKYSFEEESIEYSMMREKSQSQHKPRLFKDT